MKSKPKTPVSRRDFLKGVGLAGSGALVTLLGGREIKDVQANQLPKEPEAAQNRDLFQVTQAAYYQLEIVGLPALDFTSCTNMGSTHEAVEHGVIDVSGHEVVRVIPGRLKYNDIILERELSTDMTLSSWFEDVQERVSGFRKDGSIIALDDVYTPIGRWDFFQAWPREVTATLLPSDDDPDIYVLREHTILTVEEIYKPA